MKKITFLTALLTISAFVIGQVNMSQLPHIPLTKKVDNVFQKTVVKNASNASKTGIGAPQAKKATIWSDDFSTASNWVISADWIIGTNADDPGGANTLESWIGAMASTTAANGYAFINEIQYLVGGGVVLKDVTVATTSAIDLSSFSGVILTFEQNYYAFNSDEVYVEVSNDGGSTWTSFEVNTGVAVNSQGPPSVTVDISAAAGGSANVFVRFRWVTTSADPAFGAGYGWMVDDVSITETPPNDLTIVTDSGMLYLDSWMSPIYTKVPVRQAGAINFAARIGNIGSAAQTNVMLDVEVMEGGNTVYAGTSATLPSLAAGTNALFTLGNTFAPTNLGTYDFTFVAISDSLDINPANDTIIKSYELTDTIFQRDDDVPFFQLTAASFASTGPYEFANYYETVTADTATSISFVVGGNSIVGTPVQGKIYASDGVTLLMSTGFYQIQTGDLTGFPVITLMLDNPLPLTDTNFYYVSVADLSGSDTTVAFITTDVISDNDAIGGLLFAGGTWGGIVYYPFIRLNVKAPSVLCALSTTAATVTAVSCPGGVDGSIAGIVPSGGTAPYMYAWSPGAGTNADTSGLAPGNYMLAITDAASCTYSVSVTVDEPTAMVLNASSTDISCAGDSNGTITLNVVGGTGPFTYTWSDSTMTGGNQTGLSAGSYMVTIDDANGCAGATDSFNITEPAAMGVTFSSVTASCGLGGSATATVTGGVPPYMYLWDDPLAQTNATATNLFVGSYICTVTDSNGCVETVTDSVLGSITMTFTMSKNNPSACGVSDGDATITILTGTAPFAYSWDDPGSQNTATATGLASGPYNVTVTDSSLCTIVASITLLDDSAATLGASVVHDSCKGDALGSIAITVFGGAGSSVYAWSTVPAQTGATAIGLIAGVYSVTVTDADNCSSFLTDTVTEPATSVVIDNVTEVNITCNGDADGSLTASASGGTGGTISYAWTGGPSTAAYNSLDSGTYTIVVTDAYNCTATSTGTVTEPSALAATTVITDVNCTGETTGGIDITVTGGTGGYSYAWSNGGGFVEDLTNVLAGNYTVTVTDANGCFINKVETIQQPSVALATSATGTNETVAGANDGAITSSASGGTPNYSFSWTSSVSGFTPSTSLNLTNLAPGVYNLTVTDANGCEQMETVTIAAGPTAIVKIEKDVVFKIYPNPNTGQFIVELNNLNGREYQIEIRNLIGQLVLAESVNASNGNFYKQIGLASNETGVYFISLINDGDVITKKLVIY